MLLLVGDSRVRDVEKAFRCPALEEVTPVFLVKSGARMHVILEMLKTYKGDHQEVPVMIAIIGFLGDILVKKNDAERGYPLMQVRPDIWNKDQLFPAVEGSLQMRRNTEDEIHKLWPDVKVVWVLPYPVDLGTYVKTCATKQVPRFAEVAVNKETLQANNYMAALDKVFQREHAEDVIPWYNFWKDVANPVPEGTPDEFHEFMRLLRNGSRVPSLYPESSTDGVHPQMRTAQGLIRAILRKYNATLAKKEKAASTKNVTKEDSPLLKVDKAVQSDLGYIVISKKDPGINFVLPCQHADFAVIDYGAILLCNNCGVRYLREELECKVSMIQRIEFKLKAHVRRSSTPE